MKYFVDSQGNYLGGWSDGGPNDGIEVPFPPEDARDTWSGEKWIAYMLSRSEIENLRLMAYADPVTGSDRYFAEAVRLQAMGGTQADIDAAKSAGAARYAEIQAMYPWPA